MNECIFVFRFKLNEKTPRVVQVLNEFHTAFRIQKISSVFKKMSSESTRLDEEMVFAVVSHTNLELANLLAAIHRLGGMDYSFDLISFNNVINWTPELALPSPLLNFDPLTLHCCAEVMPSYFHPILKIDLKTMDIQNQQPDFEFLFQGKIYIDHIA